MNKLEIFKVLLSPYISEKSTLANEKNQYVFKVLKNATKAQIKVAVEKLFEVKVIAVNVVNMKPKKVRFGRIQGTQKAWKKAYVRLAEGNNIDLIGTQA